MAGRGNWIFQSLRTIVWFIYTVIIETPIIVVLSIITFPYYLLQWFLKFFKTPNVASSPLPNSKDKLLPELPNVKKYDPKKVYDTMSGYFLLLTSLDLNNIPSIGPNEVDKIVKKGSKTKQSSTDKKMKFQPKDLYYGRLNGVSGLLSLFSSVSSNETKLLFNLRDFSVDIFPNDITSGKLYSASLPLRLISKIDNDVFYLVFPSGFEKELWYISLTKSTRKINTDDYFKSYVLPLSLFLKDFVGLKSSPVVEKEEKEDDSQLSRQKSRWGFKRKNNQIQQLKEAVQRKISFSNSLRPEQQRSNMNWCNFLIGRMFISSCNTEKLQTYIHSDIMKQASKVKKPGFLGEFRIKDLFIGYGVPQLENPRVITADEYGALELSFDMDYKGGFRLDIETDAAFDIPGKQMKFKVLVSVTLKSIQGPIIIKTNPLPSSQIWYGFRKKPEIDISIAFGKLSAEKDFVRGMISDIMEQKVREMIDDLYVAPNMGCFPMYGCEDKKIRWGTESAHIAEIIERALTPNIPEDDRPRSAPVLSPKPVPEITVDTPSNKKKMVKTTSNKSMNDYLPTLSSPYLGSSLSSAASSINSFE